MLTANAYKAFLDVWVVDGLATVSVDIVEIA